MSMQAIREAVSKMSAYVPGEKAVEPGTIILNANENLYPPSPRAVEAMRGAIDGVSWYPESSSSGVRAAAAQAYAAFGIRPEQVLVSNSSDEMLRILNQACVGEGEVIYAFTPSFTFYKTLAAVQGADFRELEFPEDYTLPSLPDLRAARLIFFPNPGAPSGTLYPLTEIERLIQAAPEALVVIDEAYADFSRNKESALGLLQRYPNLVVTRTLSKSYSLAGLRVGLGFASPEIMAELNKVRDYYNLDVIAQAGAEAALRDQAHLLANCERIIATREWFARDLALVAVKVWESGANFVLARFGAPGAGEIYERLKSRKILVRYWNRPRLADCLRISIGTDEQMRRVLEEITAIVNGK